MQINALISPDIIRRKIRTARRVALRSMKTCADLLKISLNHYAAYESGAMALSLPEIELLSLFFHIPISKLLTSEEETLQLRPVSSQNKDLSAIMTLRHKIIGARIRLLREDQNLTQAELGESIGLSKSELEAFELGSSPLCLTHLYPILQALGYQYDVLIETPSKSSAANLFEFVEDSPSHNLQMVEMKQPYEETQVKIQPISDFTEPKDLEEDDFTPIRLD